MITIDNTTDSFIKLEEVNMIKEDQYNGFHDQYSRYLNVLNINSDNNQEQLMIPGSMGDGKVIHTKLRPGMELIMADCCLHGEQRLQFQSDTPSIELSFWLKGNHVVDLFGQSSLHIQDNHCQLAFHKEMHAEMHFGADTTMRACEIRIEESVLIELLGDLELNTNWDIRKLVEQNSTRVFQQAIGPAEQLHIYQMLNCSYQSPLKKLFLEGKALEMLAMYLQRFLFDNEYSEDQHKKGLRRTDLDKIREAARILVARMEQPPSLLELSRLVHISDFKLKQGFKELYGTTVFGYLRDKRMEQALLLLEMDKISVYEVAIATGYSNPSHFASVFRERYGCNPGQWKR